MTNELALFAGAGGGCLVSVLLGHRIVGYVENDSYCQQILQARIKGGCIDPAPIFGDVRKFVLSGHAREYCGVADLVSGGFPCQPFSVAGRRRGSTDKRNLWPWFWQVVREVRPRHVFAENVPGLLSWDGGSYFGRIINSLAEIGYGAEWMVLGADDCAAPHRRKRLWILATNLADAERCRCDGWPGKLGAGGRSESAIGDWWSSDPADTISTGLEVQQRKPDDNDTELPPTQRDCDQWGRRTTEPRLGRVAHGVAHRVDRIRAIGNGQIPIVAARAFRILMERAPDRAQA